MRRIRSADTKPELRVRKLVHSMGYRYRLHRRDLPGSPDLVFPGRRKLIFVHGCFWHHHHGCPVGRIPKSRPEFWVPKFERNRERDREQQDKLASMGWKVLVVWECQVKDANALKDTIREFLED